MLIWLLVLLLLSVFIYVVYRFVFFSKRDEKDEINHHYTFKI